MLTADGIYRQLQTLKLKTSTNFINFTIEDQKLAIIQYKQRVKYKTPLSWRDLRCNEHTLPSGLQIKSTCKLAKLDVARSSKVFVKGFPDFLEYVIAIQQGSVTYNQHMELFDILLAQQHLLNGYQLVNHNLDVNILHFKYVAKDDSTTPRATQDDAARTRLKLALKGHSRSKGGLNKNELLQIAKDQGLTNSSKHTRTSIVALLRKSQQ